VGARAVGGVVLGSGRATGVNSFVTGGGTATGTSSFSANGAIASALGATASGISCTASGNYSACFGFANAASGSRSFAAGNRQNVSGNFSSAFGDTATASGQYGFSAGISNTTSGPFASIALGNFAIADRSFQLAHSSFRWATGQRSQTIYQNLGVATTDDTPTECSLAGTFTIVPNTCFFGLVKICGIKTDGTKVATFIRKVAIKNVSGTTSLVGTVETIGTDVTEGTSVSITANDTSDYLSIMVTGIAAETWRWHVSVTGIEMARSA
jgi:hypothetical protein